MRTNLEFQETKKLPILCIKKLPEFRNIYRNLFRLASLVYNLTISTLAYH